MHITDLVVTRYAHIRPIADLSQGTEIIIVRVLTDEGAEGTGFLRAPVLDSGPMGDIAAALLRRHLRPLLLGQDPLLTGDLWRRMSAAVARIGRHGLPMHCIAAIDLALWDLKGKLQGVPISTLLGGRRAQVPTYANLGHQLPPDQLAERAAEYVRNGHRAIKIRGSATAVSLDEATARVREVRAAVGLDVRLMVDVNGTWDSDTATRQLKRWEPYDIYWLEEPVPPGDIAGYARVRERAGSTLIAGGEQHAGTAEFTALLGQRAIDIAQPNAGLLGGLTGWLEIYALASAHGVPVSPWDMQHVNIHTAAALPNVMWIEYFEADNPLLDFETRLFRGPRLREEHTDHGVFLLPPEQPGLGLELDDDVAAEHRVEE